MSHKRNGKAAKALRQAAAVKRAEANRLFFEDFDSRPPEERLLMMVFGTHSPCPECNNMKLHDEKCQTPNCKGLRDEASVFYTEVTDDHIEYKNGARLYAGEDY